MWTRLGGTILELRRLAALIGISVALLAVSFVMLSRTQSTVAYFSDSAESTRNTFRTGYWATATPATVWAIIDIKPESLQKKTQGKPVEAFIALPTGFDVRDIDVATVRLCRGLDPCTGAGSVPASGKPKVTEDGRLKVTFDRAAVIALLAGVTPPADVTFTVSGTVAGHPFAGQDTVKIVDPETAPLPDGTPTVSPTPTTTPSPGAGRQGPANPLPTATNTAVSSLTRTPSATPNAASNATTTATAGPAASPTTTATPTNSPSPTATSSPTATPRLNR